MDTSYAHGQDWLSMEGISEGAGGNLRSGPAPRRWIGNPDRDFRGFDKVEGGGCHRDAAVCLIHFFQNTGEEAIFGDPALLIVHDIAQGELHPIVVRDEKDARVYLRRVHTVEVNQLRPAFLRFSGELAGNLLPSPGGSRLRISPGP